MKTFYIRKDEVSVVISVYLNRDFDYLYSTESEINLMDILPSDYKVVSLNDEDKSCVISRIV